MLPQTPQALDCGGCGWERVGWWRVGLGRGYLRLPFNNCLFLFGFCLHAWTLRRRHQASQRRPKRSLCLKISNLLLLHLPRRDSPSLSPFSFPSLSGVGGSQTTQTWDFCNATEKVLSHPTLNIHKAFLEIGKAFRVTGVYGLVFLLTHNRCLTYFSFLRSYWSLWPWLICFV